MSTNNVIPTVRLDDADRERAVESLNDACVNYGFFYLDGHGIDTEFLTLVMQQSKAFFDLPLSSKLLIKDTVLNRGYTAFEEETLDPTVQTRGDTKEGFYIGKHVAEDSPEYNPAKLKGPQPWPSPETCSDDEDFDCTLFKETMERYFREAENVAFRLVQLLALSIGVDKHYFDEAFDDPMAVIRLLHYSKEQSVPDKGVYACGAHSDYGMITLLLTDENPGLQIYTKNGKWINVPPRPDLFVVNLGDMLERWTNGLFRSTKHRVLTSTDSERYSIPFFYEPAFDTEVTCLSVCCSDDNPAKWKPTTSGQHLLDKYKQTHSDFEPGDD